MSKLSFRARALDANKSLPVFHADDLPDMPDITSVSRVVPQMPTGMEKDEESEHHLQRVISAQQIYGESTRLIIPTPETTTYNVDRRQTKRNVQMPKQLIHVQAFTLEDELPEYDCDDEDLAWLTRFNAEYKGESISNLEFERMCDTLEHGCGEKIELFSLKDARILLKKDEALVSALFEYWKTRRLKLDWSSLAPAVKTEKREGPTIHDPYMAFRRRVEKMQTRKNRKNDETSYEKMLKLHRDLNRACLMLEMVKLREEKKRDLLATTLKVLETRYSNEDFQGDLLMQCYELLKQRQQNQVPLAKSTMKMEHAKAVDKLRSEFLTGECLKRMESADENRKRHSKFLKARHSIQSGETMREDKEAMQLPHHRGETDTDESDGVDGKFAFRRKSDVVYHAPRYDGSVGWSWEEPLACASATDGHLRFSYTSIKRPCRCIGFSRRRVGRGGRRMFDRALWKPGDAKATDIDRHVDDRFNTSVKNEPLLSGDRHVNLLVTTSDGTSIDPHMPPWPSFKPIPIDSPSETTSDEDTCPLRRKRRKFSMELPSRRWKAAKRLARRRVLASSFFHRQTYHDYIARHKKYDRNNVSPTLVGNNKTFLDTVAVNLMKKEQSMLHSLSVNKTRIAKHVNNSNSNTKSPAGRSPTTNIRSPHRTTLSSVCSSISSVVSSTAPSSDVYQLNFPLASNSWKEKLISVDTNPANRITSTSDSSQCCKSSDPYFLSETIASTGVSSSSNESLSTIIANRKPNLTNTIHSSVLCSSQSTQSVVLSTQNPISHQLLTSPCVQKKISSIHKKQQLTTSNHRLLPLQTMTNQQQVLKSFSDNTSHNTPRALHPISSGTTCTLQAAQSVHANKLNIAKGLNIAPVPPVQVISNGLSPSNLHHARLNLVTLAKKSGKQH